MDGSQNWQNSGLYEHLVVDNMQGQGYLRRKRSLARHFSKLQEKHVVLKDHKERICVDHRTRLWFSGFSCDSNCHCSGTPTSSECELEEISLAEVAGVKPVITTVDLGKRSKQFSTTT
eukprot:3044756-Amphidinium_carterae.1